MLNNFLFLVTFISYISLSFWQYLHISKKASCPTFLFQALSLIPISLNAWFLYTWIDIAGGQNLEWVNMLAFTAWCMTIIILLCSAVRPILNLTLISYLFAGFTFLICFIFSGINSHIVITKVHPKMLYHILFSIFGISLLGLAAIQSGTLLLQLSHLKNHPNLAVKQFLPPLEIMEQFLIDILCLGCIILGSGLALGIYYLPTAQIVSYLFMPKTILSLLGFTLISFTLIRKLFFGLRTSLLAKSTLASICILIFSYFGIK